MPQTPVARLDAVKTRLKAMVEAMKAIRPKLQDFYTSLSDEQKAKFNIMGPAQGASAQQQDGLGRRRPAPPLIPAQAGSQLLIPESSQRGNWVPDFAATSGNKDLRPALRQHAVDHFAQTRARRRPDRARATAPR